MENKKTISHSKSKGRLEISISHAITKGQLNLIMAWLILWSFCGGIILFSLFFPFTREVKMMMLVWLSFWIYFEIKAYRTWKWKRSGIEKLLIENGELMLFSGMDEKRFKLVDVKSITVVPESKFRSVLSGSFWNVGEPSIYFRAAGSNHGFGRQLSREEAIRVEKLVKPCLEHISS